MHIGIRVFPTASEDLLQYILRRDAALWIGAGLDTSAEATAALARLVELPWQMVICESSSAVLAQAFSNKAGAAPDRLVSQRGFINVIASNPEDILLPPRTLPVYLINGRDDATNRDESPNLGKQGAARRRANMIGRLLDEKPQLLVAISAGPVSPLDAIVELWREEAFRAQVAVVSQGEGDVRRLEDWLSGPEHPPIVQLYSVALPVFASELTSLVGNRTSDARLVIRTKRNGEIGTLDVTDAELIEHPLLDRYDLVQDRDLHGILPHELPNDAQEKFFDRSAFADRSATRWAPYAAGLPWVRDEDAVRTVLRALQGVEAAGADHNELLLLPSEAGAGGTTASRAIAFETAKVGYPTLVATPAYFRAEPTELSRFLFRVHKTQLKVVGEDDNRDADQRVASGRLGETPWLIVFDVHHWRGKESDLVAFVRRLSFERRPAVVLCVVDSASLGTIRNYGRLVCDTLTHGLSGEEAARLGDHLNVFLRPKGRERTSAEWQGFWERHSPKVGSFGTSNAAFWVALEFFLKLHIDLQQPIQSWLIQKFKNAPLSVELRRVLLEVAALSVERQPYPEALLPSAPADQYPYSVQLESLRREVPALALARYATATEKQWAISHDLLARYLLNGIFADRALLESIGFGKVTDPILLRIGLLESIATRPELARKKYLPLALEFAVNILKLDRDGNREFFGHWREVLGILERMPSELWDTSRTFNHHVAISRRRVVRDEQLFELSLAEKRDQLELAIEHLRYALDRLIENSEDERDLNLYNSLARTYQDFADVERAAGTDATRVRQLSELAANAARRAYEEDPHNSYVLETFARDLLLQGSLYDDKAVENACQGLILIYQALRLASAPLRQQRLSALVEQAIALLRSAKATEEIERLYLARNAAGYVAKAWLLLAQDRPTAEPDDLTGVPKERLEAALRILDEVPPGQSTWLTLNLQYQLLSAASPYDFKPQLSKLDELEVGRFKLNLQQQLERALLLHQCGRHKEANEGFRLLRRELRERDTIVEVPPRLRNLLDGRTRAPLICDGVIMESGGYRPQARVRDLGDAEVRLIPQDFGFNAMKPGIRFKCQITFGWKGPLAKPVPASTGG